MKRRRLSDKAYVIRDREPFIGDTQFYVSRQFRKRYSGNILNEGTNSFRVFLESMDGYFSQPRTLPAGEVLEFQDYPLSGVTFRGQGIFTMVAWASDTFLGYVRTTAQRTVNVNNFPALSNINVQQWGGTAQTGADLTPLFQHLNTDLTTRASQATLALVLGQLDVALSTRASQATVAAILAQLDVALSTRASQATAAAILAQLVAGIPITNWPAVYPASQSGVWSTGRTWALAAPGDSVNVGNWPVSYPVTNANLDVALSTRASQATLASVLAQLDVLLSTRASEATLATRALEAGGNLAAAAASLNVMDDWDDVDKCVTIPKAKGKTTRRAFALAINGNNVLYTVSAGKTLYLTSLFLHGSNLAAGAAGTTILEVDDAGSGVFTALIAEEVWSAAGATTSSRSNIGFSPAIPMPFTAATVFRVRSTAANVVAYAGITGWEE